MKARISAIALVFFLSAVGLGAQTSEWIPASGALPEARKTFTSTALGRFETVAVGSFPIMLFYAGFGFDMAKFVGNGYDPAYAPWPFKDARAPALSQDELKLRLGSAVALSLGIAILDLVIKPFAQAKKARERPDSIFPEPPADTKGNETRDTFPPSGE